MRKLAIAPAAEPDCSSCCGSSKYSHTDLSCMARELAIARAEMHPGVAYSFQTIAHSYASESEWHKSHASSTRYYFE
jgi:hypothetical protein